MSDVARHHWQCDWNLDQGPECTCGLTGPRAWIMDWLPADRAPTQEELVAYREAVRVEVIAMDVEAERLKAECRGKA